MQSDQHLLFEGTREMVVMQLIMMPLSTRVQSCPHCQRFSDQNEESCQVHNNVCMRYVVMSFLYCGVIYVAALSVSGLV